MWPISTYRRGSRVAIRGLTREHEEIDMNGVLEPVVVDAVPRLHRQHPGGRQTLQQRQLRAGAKRGLKSSQQESSAGEGERASSGMISRRRSRPMARSRQ
jgi:hypothetical protein